MLSRLPILFIITTVVIDAMGIGLIMPVMPDLMQEISGGTLAHAAIWGGILSSAFAVMQFLFGPVIGNLSDRFGRRPVLLLSLVVMAADYLVMALAGSMWLLFVGRIVGGITAATHATASAYMADISKPHEKAANFGLIGAGFGIGFVLGPVIGGVLAEFGTRAPFYGAAVLALLNALLGYLVLKETVTDNIRRPFSWRRANPLSAFRAISRLPGLRALLTVFLFYQIASAVYPAIWPYFTTERFNWSPGMIGLSLAVFGLFYAAVQGLLVGPSIRKMGERRTVIIGLCIEFGSLVLLAFVSSTALLFGAIPLTALGAIGLPALQGIMSQRVADDQQGELQGVLTSVTSVATIIAPLVMTQTFAIFSIRQSGWYMPGAPFLLASALMAGSLMIFWRSKSAHAGARPD